MVFETTIMFKATIRQKTILKFLSQFSLFIISD